ncbi:hypothetical protein JCM11251_005340 [Rhodosporidiobolus azoricus]
MNRSDPNQRRQSYHSAPVSSSGGQRKRRETALAAQKERRTHAIEAARSSFQQLDWMEDLSLDGGSDESDSAAPPPGVPIQQPPQSPEQAEAPPNISKIKRKAFKPRFKAWAKNLLSHPETLDLRHSLPEGLETDWRVVVIPKGKRCLLATSTDSTTGNTILYSRVAGRTLARLRTVLPPDCLLDTTWDASLGVLWVLDVMKWRSQYLVNCDADMRAFFISSKLSELDTQPYTAPPDPSNPSRPTSSTSMLILPAPSYGPPLTPSNLIPLLSSCSTPSSMSTVVFRSPSFEGLSPQTVSIPFHPDGLLLYLSAAHYESGTTPLVGWIPLEVKEREMRNAEGVDRFRELVEAWDKRGGEAAAVSSGAEVQMDAS